MAGAQLGNFRTRPLRKRKGNCLAELGYVILVKERHRRMVRQGGNWMTEARVRVKHASASTPLAWRTTNASQPMCKVRKPDLRSPMLQPAKQLRFHTLEL